MLPADNHVHTEFSIDAVHGSMAASCARAVALGLPSIAFTEHIDLAAWKISPNLEAKMRGIGQSILYERMIACTGPDGRCRPPLLAVEAYLECVERCRAQFPDLRILTGVELGEPHWFPEQTTALLARGPFDRILGSQHSIMIDGECWLSDDVLADDGPGTITPDGFIRTHLSNTLRLVETALDFQVLAHIDYAVRRWPAALPPFDITRFEDEHRAVLHALARSGRALEVNTRLPMDARIVRWWHEVGGQAVSFGSDAHEPAAVARGFPEAMAMVEAAGFHPAADPLDFWRRA